MDLFITKNVCFKKYVFLHSYISVLNREIIFNKEFDYYFLEDNISEYFLIPVLCCSI